MPAVEHNTIIAARRAECRRRRKQLSLLLLRGYRDPRMLADHFNVGIATIRKDVRALDARWEATELDLTAKRKARLIAELQLLKRESWQAWEDSKKPDYEERETDAEPGKDGVKPAKKITRKRSGPRTGDECYLARISDCIAKEMTILGIRAPADGAVQQLVQINNHSVGIDLGRLTPEVTAVLCGEIDRIDSMNGRPEIEAEFETLELPDAKPALSDEERAAAQAELGIKPLEDR